MSALSNASTEVLEHHFGLPPPKGGGAQPVAKHDQARITTFFTRNPVPGKPPGTRQQQEEPPEEPSVLPSPKVAPPTVKISELAVDVECHTSTSALRSAAYFLPCTSEARRVPPRFPEAFIP
eukprot:182705-Chlamydomonas_euryale.AAC.20